MNPLNQTLCGRERERGGGGDEADDMHRACSIMSARGTFHRSRPKVHIVSEREGQDGSNHHMQLQESGFDRLFRWLITRAVETNHAIVCVLGIFPAAAVWAKKEMTVVGIHNSLQSTAMVLMEPGQARPGKEDIVKKVVNGWLARMQRGKPSGGLCRELDMGAMDHSHLWNLWAEIRRCG